MLFSALAPTTITSQSPRLTSSTSHNLRSSSKQTTAALKQTQKTITTIPPVVPPPLAPPVISPHLGSNSAATTPVIEQQQQQPDSSIMTQYEELKSKAMTSRARRIIANARERNRVHTISSAFEVHIHFYALIGIKNQCYAWKQLKIHPHHFAKTYGSDLSLLSIQFPYFEKKMNK